MKDNKNWEMLIKPVVVLTVICLIVSGLLAVTNSVTAPIIEENDRKVADAARTEVLPDADSFTLVDYSDEIIREVYKAENGTGYVLTGAAKGYGGDLPVMIGITAEGKISIIKVMTNEETPGVGKRVQEPAFTEQFAGVESTADIVTISGATISSTAVLKVVDGAFAAYSSIVGG